MFCLFDFINDINIDKKEQTRMINDLESAIKEGEKKFKKWNSKTLKRDLVRAKVLLIELKFMFRS